MVGFSWAVYLRVRPCAVLKMAAVKGCSLIWKGLTVFPASLFVFCFFSLFVLSGCGGGVSRGAGGGAGGGGGGGGTPSKPNLARFYMKWDSWMEQDPSGSYTDEYKRKIARNVDIIFAIPEDEVQNMKQVIQSLPENERNPNLKLILYWNMRRAWRNGRGIDYPDESLLRENWPSLDGNKLVVCDAVSSEGPKPNDYVVDISNTNPNQGLGPLMRVLVPYVRNLLNQYGYDGVFFDLSAWHVYYHKDIGIWENGTCRKPNQNLGFVQEFLPDSKDFAVHYHKHMQENVLDPGDSNTRIHISNGIPNSIREWDLDGDYYLDQYFNTSRIDGMQMDSAIISRGRIHEPAEIDFQLKLPKKFVERGRYFLFKSHVENDDRLELAFSAYLMVADGRYVLFGAAGRVADWENDPILTAPLGNALGEYQPLSSFTYMRLFERGVVCLNADTQDRTISLPEGSYRDVRRGTTHSGRIDIPAQSGRILIRVDNR